MVLHIHKTQKGKNVKTQKRQKRAKTAKMRQKWPKTKLSITRSIFKLEAPDFAWYSIYTKRKKTQKRQKRAKNGQKLN